MFRLRTGLLNHPFPSPRTLCPLHRLRPLHPLPTSNSHTRTFTSTSFHVNNLLCSLRRTLKHRLNLGQTLVISLAFNWTLSIFIQEYRIGGFLDRMETNIPKLAKVGELMDLVREERVDVKRLIEYVRFRVMEDVGLVGREDFVELFEDVRKKVLEGGLEVADGDGVLVLERSAEAFQAPKGE
ncbi:hypothetical protein HK097_001987 [Rhizophlyctis rosea]|uniref:Uncharacterized protein n=1 Tax=Rhizophlyctis rosea TaxID=64517 RepID=A0AAD5X7A2_9FUNG|nr:hypothetical protein HK097_001987 [Rhizophlyctis rosea]